MKSFIHLLIATSTLGLFSVSGAAAYDMTGAWANDVSACEKIFVKKGGTAAFKPKSDIYGSGFIVDKNQIKGRFATCRITSQKESGEILHILAACSTDIMLSNIQFTLKIADANNVIRQFPGMEEMRLQYTRCP